MKRVFTILMVVVLLVGTLSAGTVFYARAALQVVGDVNGDGRVNNRDLGYLQQVLNEWDVTVEGDADVNGDDKVNNRDMGELQQIINSDTKQPKASVATKYVSLGAPAAQFYPNNRLARCAWDMIIFDDRLYVGCGDYSNNSGDTPILSCPMDDLGNWSVEYTIPGEEVGRFININGVLTIPSYDPVGMPEYSPYYELMGNQWKQRDAFPYGLHTFDVVWFQGRIYGAIGADRGGYPIAYTEDGVVYQEMPLYKDGKPVDTTRSNVVRSANLYVLGDELYADFWYEDELASRSIYEMYHYNAAEDRFDYISDLKSNTHGGMYSAANLPLWEKVALGNKMFLTTGYMYYTTDFEQYHPITMPNDAIVYDMMECDGRLYILTAYATGSKYQVTIYSTTSANPSNLRTEATYNYSLAPTAFAVDADNFFVGMGNWFGRGAAGNGTILQIER